MGSEVLPVTSDDRITLSALKFLTGVDCERVCRLCFASTEDEGLALHDVIGVKKPYIDENVTFVDMFADLGVDLQPELPQTLCVSCGTIVMNSYLFRRLCEFSNKKWSETVNKLETTLRQSLMINPSSKSAYLMMNGKENIILTSRKRGATNDKSKVLAKIRNIISYKRKYSKMKFRNNYVCDECGFKFGTLQILLKHMRAHHDITSRIPCPQCVKYFSTVTQLQEHEERVHYPKTFQCGKCVKKFGSLKMLKRHEKKSHIAVICKLCFAQLPSRDALKNHLDKHEDNMCPRCNKTYTNRQTYTQHLKICGNNFREGTFMCDICGKKYIRKNGLRTHLKVDHGFGSVLSCNWCNKKFDAVSKLKIHIVKHTRERKFYCQQCGGKFVTKAALVYHVRLHTGEKPFPCDICGESFLSASRRMAHKRRKHLGPTKECHICFTKFVSKFQLTRHVQRHYNPQSKLYIPTLQDNKDVVVKEVNDFVSC